MDLSNVLDSENFDLGLLSVEAGSELLGAINRLPENQKMMALKKVWNKRAPVTLENNSRSEFLKKMSLLPGDIQMGLVQKRLQLVDSAYYFVKNASGLKNIKMITDTDNKAPGLGNVSKQKLEKDNHFLMDGIVLLAGTGAQKETVSFDIIPKEIRNGDFQLKINGSKTITPASRVSCEVFDTTGRTDIRRGLWKLDNPKLVEAESGMEFDLDAAASVAENTWVKTIMLGSSVVPY